MKTNKTFQINIPISKVDEDQRIVTGIATTEALDSQGDIVDYEASKKAFSDWPGNIREMHGPVAIGKGIDVQFDDDSKQVIVSAKISESADGENAWIKVKEKILTGFSIGGRVFEVAKDKAVEGATRILDYSLSELSLVDNPANPQAELLMVKSASGGLQRVEEDKSQEMLPQAWWAKKFMGAPVQKSVYDAQEALSLAAQLTWLIMSEEPDQRDDLVTAFNALRDFAAKEVQEGDDFDWQTNFEEIVELANKAINLRKGKNMSEVKKGGVAVVDGDARNEKAASVAEVTAAPVKKAGTIVPKKVYTADGKTVAKTNVVGGEERNLDAKVTETAEQAGRPVNDTQERADAAGVPEVGALVDDKDKKVEDEDKAVDVKDREYADDDKTKTPDDTARNDITPPQDKEVVVDEAVEEPSNDQTIDSKEQTVNDTKEDRSPAIAVDANPDKSDDEKKSDDPADLLKNVKALLTKLNDNESETDLKKMSTAFEKLSDKVEKSISSLEDRLAVIEKQPTPTKGKQYAVVVKGDSEEENTDLKAIQKRQDYLAEHPQEAKQGEMEEIYKSLRKAQIGEAITIK